MKDLRFLPKDAEIIAEFEKFLRKRFIHESKRLIDLSKQRAIVSNDLKNYWTELKIPFYNKHKRCAICEKKLNEAYSIDVEHFKPEVKFWWLAYNPKNYYLCCATCNRAEKNDDFPFANPNVVVNYSNRKNLENETPLLINPLYENPYDYFQVVFGIDKKSPQHKVVMLAPKKDLRTQNPLFYQKAKETIKIFNLDLKKDITNARIIQAEWNRKLHQKLFELAKKVINQSSDLQTYYDSLEEEIKELGYAKMIMSGQVII